MQWNSDENLQVATVQDHGLVTWKGSNVVLQGDCVIARLLDGGSKVELRVRAYCPFQTTEWLPGMVGMTEWIILSGSVGPEGIIGRALSGTFQRRGEGPLSCSARFVGAVPASAPHSAPDKVYDEGEECSICMCNYSDAKPAVVTKCGHAWCAQCIVSVLAISPPSDEGRCPGCRAPVKLSDLTFRSSGRSVH